MRLIDGDALLGKICGECCGCEPEECGYLDEYRKERCKVGQYVINALTIQPDAPRVMTLEETKAFGWDYCYLEELRLPGKEYRAVCGDYALTCITWPCIASMRIQHGDGSYNKTWRCWTARPTDEQRKAVKWDE